MPYFAYKAFGMKVRSELALPAPTSPIDGQADVTIRFDRLGLSLPDPNTPQTTLITATPTEICCYWQNAGFYSVRDGREIIIDPDPNADHAVLADWLQSAALSLLLHQRGLFVLHASAVAVNGKAVAFVGEAGWGKSTTAAAMREAGHPLVTDDLVAVDFSGQIPLVVPGFPHMKLVNETATRFDSNAAALPSVAGDPEKRLRRLHDGFHETPLPLSCICLLGFSDPLSLHRLAPQEAVLTLIRHAFVARMTDFLNCTQTAAAHFHACTKLAASPGVFHLQRPKDLAQLPQLVKRIESHVGRNAEAA